MTPGLSETMVFSMHANHQIIHPRHVKWAVKLVIANGHLIFLGGLCRYVCRFKYSLCHPWGSYEYDVFFMYRISYQVTTDSIIISELEITVTYAHLYASACTSQVPVMMNNALHTLLVSQYKGKYNIFFWGLQAWPGLHICTQVKLESEVLTIRPELDSLTECHCVFILLRFQHFIIYELMTQTIVHCHCNLITGCICFASGHICTL